MKFRSLKVSLETLERSFHCGDRQKFGAKHHGIYEIPPFDSTGSFERNSLTFVYISCHKPIFGIIMVALALSCISAWALI